jgi:hypothetical protein
MRRTWIRCLRLRGFELRTNSLSPLQSSKVPCTELVKEVKIPHLKIAKSAILSWGTLGRSLGIPTSRKGGETWGTPF